MPRRRRLAALRIAKFKANPCEIVKKDPDRAKRGEGKVRAARTALSRPPSTIRCHV